MTDPIEELKKELKEKCLDGSFDARMQYEVVLPFHELLKDYRKRPASEEGTRSFNNAFVNALATMIVINAAANFGAKTPDFIIESFCEIVRLTSIRMNRQ